MARTARDKFTKQELSWIFYDWANSSHSTIIVAAILPIFFVSVAKGAHMYEADYWWGVGTSIATFAMIPFAPILGSIADLRGMKKILFSIFLAVGLSATAVIVFAQSWQLMLVGYIFSYFGFMAANLFYDSFLTDVTTPDRMDRVSTYGYGFGYIGGSTIPFILAILLVMFGKQINISGELSARLAILIVVFWWGLFSIPILRNVKQVHYVERSPGLMAGSFKRIWQTIRDIFTHKGVLFFVIAYFFYIDGVNTVINMATAYGATLGLDSTGMILALMLTQLVAFPCAILFGRLAKRFGTIRMIGSAIAVYFVICLLGFYMGDSIQPSQNAYIQKYEQAFDAASAKLEYGWFSDKQVETFKEKQLAVLKLDGENILGSGESRAENFAELVEDQVARVADFYADANTRMGARTALYAVQNEMAPFLKDMEVSRPFDEAIRFSTMLFWILAVMVGTVQGGIQALSRSFFGKIIPPEKSNEYFGFFDIFGKFAAVLGPALYALTRKLTGNPADGILSVIILFALGGATILLGRKELRAVEAHATSKEDEAIQKKADAAAKG